MRGIFGVFFLMIMLMGFSVYAQQEKTWSISQKIPPGHLKKDLNKLHHGLYKNHPGLFDYIDPIVWDDLTDSIFMNSDTAMNVLEFYRTFVPMVTRVGCGHTVVEPPVKVQEYLRKEGKLFPLTVRFFDDKMYAFQNGSEIDTIPQGWEITEINGRSSQEVLNLLFEYIPSNANTSGRKYGTLEEFFELYYALVIGQPERFTINGINKIGKSISYTVKANSADKIERQIEERYNIKLGVPYPYAAEVSEMLNTAVLTLHSFDKDLYDYAGVNFKAELDSLCLEMNQKKVQNLIIDLRDNKGGSRMMATTLLSRFINEPVLNNDVVYVASQHPILNHGDLALKKHMRGAKVHKAYRKYQIKNRYLQMQVNPAEYRFKGKLIVLINKNTFSAASHIASFLREYCQATLIGQTSSGFEFYSNAGFFYNCWMGHTGFLVKVPYFQSWYFDAPAGKTQLLSPDYVVKETMDMLLEEQDVVMQKAISLIRESEIK